ncbi:MAG: TRAP transporter substrate-binding protein DctP, partial [bacterium]
SAIVSRSGSTGGTLDDRKLTSSAASSASEPPRAASSLDTHAPSAGTTEINTAMPIDRFSSARTYRPHAAWPDPATYDGYAKQTIRLATILPDGAPGTTELEGVADAIQKASGDHLGLKLYLGVSGDEKDIVKKLEINQLQAAHLTGLGLAEILPSIHVLDLPFFFTSYAQVDRVYDGVLSYFQQAFREKGFEFLGFTETGFVYLYSNRKIQNLADLQQAKIWAAEGDPLTAAFVAGAKIQSVPLAIPDVLTSLQIGLIDTVYGPPAGMIGLQWFTKVKYVQAVPFVHATGGLVMTKKAFDKLPPEMQAPFATTVAEQAELITQSLRKVNEESKREIQKAGVTALPEPSAEVWMQLRDIAQRVTESEAGHLYPRELLDGVRRLRDEAAAAEASH